jgi:hypothetical protein
VSTQAARELRAAQLRVVAAALLGAQPGATAYLVNASAGPLLLPGPADKAAPMTLVLGLLKELQNAGRARSEDGPNGAYWSLTPDGTAWYRAGNQITGGAKTGNRTGDETMTPPKSPVTKARARQVAAAKRSLTLILEAAARHAEMLNKGEIPDGTFRASVAKYEDALTVIAALDALGETPDGGSDGLAEVRRDDLQALVAVARIAFPGAGEPLARLAEAAEGPPWNTAEPAAEPAAEGTP